MIFTLVPKWQIFSFISIVRVVLLFVIMHPRQTGGDWSKISRKIKGLIIIVGIGGYGLA